MTIRPILALALTGVVAAPVAAQAKPVKVTGEQTTFTLNSAATQFLTDNGLTVTAVAPATVSGSSATFPIVGGRVNHKITKGFVRHAGGLTFTAESGKSLTVRRPVAVVRRNKGFVAVHYRHRLVRVFRLTDVSKTTSGTTTTVTAQLSVTKHLAKQLNRRLGTSVQPGAAAGSATSTLTTS